ncbi:MAG: hypothetical protein M1823_005035 [Watsoniomyces obsoletus]|nr:MAG: hypothetical protein M1823_005035 [Watsoniomyces obsoletus]
MAMKTLKQWGRFLQHTLRHIFWRLCRPSLPDYPMFDDNDNFSNNPARPPSILTDEDFMAALGALAGE